MPLQLTPLCNSETSFKVEDCVAAVEWYLFPSEQLGAVEAASWDLSRGRFACVCKKRFPVQLERHC